MIMIQTIGIILVTYVLGASSTPQVIPQKGNVPEDRSFQEVGNLKKDTPKSSVIPAAGLGGNLDPDKVKFYLYSKERPTEAVRVYVNDFAGLEDAGYSTDRTTKVIIHGFLNSLTSNSIQKIKNNFLNISYEDVNVIAVDWSYYATVYWDVFDITSGVGELVAEFIDFLVKEGTLLKDVHCIGHSLGAHVCGFSGSKVKKGLIGRITGLDPAQYKFHDGSSKRLNSTDAKFVDCIHTNAGQLGLTAAICTADYYPNKGKRQPGCQWADIFSLGGCSHGRSFEYFAESILPGHEFPALSCNSTDFNTATCIDKGALMGYPATQKWRGILYTETNSQYPFAKDAEDF